MNLKLSRRSFLQLSASATGGLFLSAHLPVLAANATAQQTVPWIFIDIGTDGTVTIGARGAEIGQGVRTSLPMLIAEELDVDWSSVSVVQLPYVALANENEDGHTSKYGSQGAGGSTSIPGSYNELRKLGATARQLLVETAAERWQVPTADLTTSSATVHCPNGDTLSYAELVSDATKRALPSEDPVLKKSDQFKVIGLPTRQTDIQEIATGQGYYGIDATLPGALIAVMARCPWFEGDIDTVDDSQARKIPGVRHIIKLPAPDFDNGITGHMAAGVAVVADDTWAAMSGRNALKIKWKPGKWAGDSTAALIKRAHTALKSQDGQKTRADGDVHAATAEAAQQVDATYTLPFLAHSTLEPQNALVDIQHNQVTIVTSTQQPARVSRVVSEITGVDRANIDIEMPRSGGGFGRRLEVDCVAEAVLIAQQVKKPVKLIWTREDDMQNDFYRPFGVHRFHASLDNEQNISSWSHQLASNGKRYLQPGFSKAPAWLACMEPDQFPAGCLSNYIAEFFEVPFGLLGGWWRGPAPTFLAFPIQSFLDEVAIAANIDPLALRLKLLGEARDLKYRDHGGPVFNTGRLAVVTQKVADEIQYGRKLPKGRGIGLASHFVFGGYAAHAMEVSVENGKVKIHRCICAVDVGQVVNPLGVEKQMSGGTIDGISTALGLEITVKDGQIEQQNFPSYPHLKMADAPDVDVHIINTDNPPSGAGEMGIPTAAPALTNAIYAATGKRIRTLPIGRQLA